MGDLPDCIDPTRAIKLPIVKDQWLIEVDPLPKKRGDTFAARLLILGKDPTGWSHYRYDPDIHTFVQTTPRRMRVGVDVGGVLSKYPELFKALMTAPAVEWFIVSDMHPKDKIQKMLRMNGIELDDDHVASADYSEHGELCKAVVSAELELDLLIDDFPGYMPNGVGARLLMWPDPEKGYYAPEWKTDGSEGNFGRRKTK